MPRHKVKWRIECYSFLSLCLYIHTYKPKSGIRCTSYIIKGIWLKLYCRIPHTMKMRTSHFICPSIRFSHLYSIRGLKPYMLTFQHLVTTVPPTLLMWFGWNYTVVFLIPWRCAPPISFVHPSVFLIHTASQVLNSTTFVLTNPLKQCANSEKTRCAHLTGDMGFCTNLM